MVGRAFQHESALRESGTPTSVKRRAGNLRPRYDVPGLRAGRRDASWRALAPMRRGRDTQGSGKVLINVSERTA